MGKRHILILTLYLSALVLAEAGFYLLLREHAFPTADPFLQVPSALILAVLITAGSIVFKPVRESIEEWVTRDLDRDICRICLFGQAGSGKTSLMKYILAARKILPESSTTEFDVYEGNIKYDVHRNSQFKALIADYKGDQPSMAILDLPDKFAGSRDDRAINVLLFMVDLLPRIADLESRKVLGDDETLIWFKTETHEKIQKRVAQHLDYLVPYMLQVVFSSVLSRRPARNHSLSRDHLAMDHHELRSVRLVITKFDLVEKAQSLGYVRIPKGESLENWARGHFARVERDIRSACQENGIQDFSVHVVSLTRGTDMPDLLDGLWSQHLQARSDV
jgi:hypothetical protein